MKRKVIQIAGSTQLISLPRPWAKKYNILKGDELDVNPVLNKIIVSAGPDQTIEKVSIDISGMDSMIVRVINALYKKGIDEVRVNYDNPDLIKEVQKSISNETVGFEILEQGKNYCVLKYLTGPVEEFDSLIRRTFLLLMTMADNAYNLLKEEDYSHLKGIITLEETNNRFTTMCRRRLNKNGTNDARKIGPLYFIVESLEKAADDYKYICQHFSKLDPKKDTIRKEVLALFNRSNQVLREFYELFYKFDADRLNDFKNERSAIINDSFALFKKDLTQHEILLIHWSLNITYIAFVMGSVDMINKF